MSTDAGSRTLQLVGNGAIGLESLRSRLGMETARAEFERLIEDIVALKHPDVRAVRANPGDWGIDAFVGQLAEGGSVMVWQAKYFIDDFEKTQKDDVTRSTTRRVLRRRARGTRSNHGRCAFRGR